MKARLTFVLLAAALLLAPSAFADKNGPSSKDELQFGVKMAQRGLWSEALFRFQLAERMGDDRAAVFNNIAVAYEALGVFEKALEHYRKALDRDSQNPNLKRNYSRFIEFYQSFNPQEEGAESESEAPAGGAEARELSPESGKGS